MRVGLVLGAGGVLGGAWLTGALHALATETEWDPASADHIVGTSAGSMIGGLVAAGVPPWFMVAHSGGESFEGLTGADGRPAAEADRSAGAVFRLHRGLPPIGPGSLRLALSSLTAPARHTPAALAAGWIPRGFISTESLERTIRRVVPSGWADHDAFWAVACDYASGKRVAFGRAGSPPADMARAVAASCAIPGFYHPVRIGSARYVDGGMRSASNLDLLAGQGLDLVICLNPTSSRERGAGDGLGDRVARSMRSASGRRLGHEARRLRSGGTQVVLLQPVAEDLAVMGNNLMSGRRRHEVIETAVRTMTEALSQGPLREELAELPPGEPHKIRRPAGDPASWPEFLPAGARRAA
jgi:NTE family protein